MAATCVLVNFPGYPTEPFGFVPDNGMAMLAAVLEDAGHSVTIEDFATVSTMENLFPAPFEEELRGLGSAILDRVNKGLGPTDSQSAAMSRLESAVDGWQDVRMRVMAAKLAARVAAQRPSFVGFKLWTGQGFAGSVAMANAIKNAAPEVKIYGGGPNVDWFMEHAARVANVFDAMAYGEGEGTILELAEHSLGRRRLRDVKGIIAPNGMITPAADPVDLDRLPLPRYDGKVYPAMSAAGEKIRVFPVDESRGCPNSCHFCCHPAKSGRRRVMDPGLFVDRLDALRRLHGATHFRFAGSNPPVLQRSRIAKGILDKGLKIRFGGFAHVSNGLSEDFGLLAAAGCAVLSFGVESGSQDVLDRAMNKGVDVAGIRTALLECKRAGIAAVASLIVPAPFETADTLEETFDLMVKTRPDSTMVHFPAMVPGTAWERHRERFGFEAPAGAEYAQRLMRLRLRHFGSPVLWRPVDWFRLNGRSAPEMAAINASFSSRLRAAGLETQVYDSVFLIAGAAGMAASRAAREFGSAMAMGDGSAVREMVERANRGMNRPACASDDYGRMPAAIALPEIRG